MLQNWDAWKPCFDSALGIKPETFNAAPRRPQQGENITGWRDPIQAFNQSNSVESVLMTAAYKTVGRDRFTRPGSESKAPGAVIMRNCSDGIERVYSHGGDVLNDGFAHDAFDCLRLLVHGGDWTAALKWNSEIEKHNRRLFMQDKAKSAPQQPEQTFNDVGNAEPKEILLFPFVSASTMTDKPIQVEWLVENILEQGSLNLLFGEPGAGKSLFALDWAWCMAAGLDWHDYRTKQTDVVIIAGEGFAGMARRLKALENKYQMKAPERLFISQRPAQLLDEKNALWVANSIKAMCPNPSLVIIDTLHRNMDGDENSSQDIGKFINNIDLFMKPLGAAVLIVHHSGHGDKQRSRGSSSIRAAMDGEFSATKSDGGIILACHKAKDFEALAPLQFALKPTDLSWLDEDGEPMTSVYLEHRGEVTATSKRRKLSARDDAILTSLSESIAAHGVEPTTDIKLKFGGFESLFGEIQQIVHVDYWRELAYKTISVDCADDSKQDALRKAFKRCRDKLFNDGLTVEHGDYVWRVFN